MVGPSRPARPSPRGNSRAEVPLRSNPLILVASQEEVVRSTLRRVLQSADFSVEEAAGGQDLLDRISHEVHVVMADLHMADISGRDCLSRIRKQYPDTPVMLISRSGNANEVAATMREGAFECFTGSCHLDRLVGRVRQAVCTANLARENRRLKQLVSYLPGTDDGDVKLAGLTLAEIERRAIIETIRTCGGNKAKTARTLDVSEKTIYNKIRQYNLRGVI